MGQAAGDLTSATPGATATDPRPSADELRAQIERQRSELGRDLEVLGDKVSPGRMVQRRRARMRQGMQGMRQRLMGATEAGSSRMRDAAGSMQQAPDMARETTQGAPIAVGLVAFGLGAVAASLLPASEQERRLAQQAQPVLQRAAEEAGHVAREEMDELEPRAREAVAEVRSTAEEAGQRVKDEATSAAGEVRGSAQVAQGPAEEVRGPGPTTGG